MSNHVACLHFHVFYRAFGDAYIRREDVRHATLLFCAGGGRPFPVKARGNEVKMKITNKEAKEFLLTMAKVYVKAVSSMNSKADVCIVRGRAHCVAADFEDEFAVFISKKIKRKGRVKRKERVKLYVFSDFPITVSPVSGSKKKSKKKNETRYIDFMICEELTDGSYKVLYMAELKTNTGWMRDGVDTQLSKNHSVVAHLKKQGTKISAKIDSLKEACIDEKIGRKKFVVSEELCYDLIVLSSSNNNKQALDKVEHRFENECRLIVLSDYPFSGKQRQEFNPKPRMNDFNELGSRIVRSLRHLAK